MNEIWRRLSEMRLGDYERIRLQLLQQIRDMDAHKYGEKSGPGPLILAAQEDVKVLKQKVAEMESLIEAAARECGSEEAPRRRQG